MIDVKKYSQMNDTALIFLCKYFRWNTSISEYMIYFYIKDGNRMSVTQYHFTAWPDKGVPKFAPSLVNFRRKIITSTPSSDTPILVHCRSVIFFAVTIV